MARSRPSNTRVTNVINFGVDKRLPLGFVDVVTDNETGLWVGYMKDGSFYPLGVDAKEFDKEQKAAVQQAGKKDKATAARGPASAVGNPLINEFGKYKLQVTTDPENGKTYVSGIASGTDVAEEHFLYIGPDNKINVTSNFDIIRSSIVKDIATQPGAGDAVFNAMYSAGLIGKDTFDKKDFSAPDFNKGLQYAVRNYSINAIDAVNVKGAKEIQSFASYLQSSGEGSLKGTTRTTTESFVTKRADAADEADRFFMQYLGRGATKSEENAYYEALRELERKSVASRTAKYDAEGNLLGSVSTGELVDELDRTLLLGKVAGKAIKGSNVDELLTAGGRASGDIQNIMSIANQYGLIMTQEDAMNYVATNLRKGKSVEQTKNKLIKLSQTKYQNIANLIDDDISVKDIASQYIYDMSQILEVNASSINVNDPTIQAALLNNNNQGTMSITDFNTMLRKDARWGKTNNARNTAASYGLEILKSFGLVS
jgi:hypothetical protein